MERDFSNQEGEKSPVSLGQWGAENTKDSVKLKIKIHFEIDYLQSLGLVDFSYGMTARSIY